MNKKVFRQAIVDICGNDNSSELEEIPLNDAKLAAYYNKLVKYPINEVQVRNYIKSLQGKNDNIIDYLDAKSDAKIHHDKNSQSIIQWDHKHYGCNLFFWNDYYDEYDAFQYFDALNI